MSTAKTTEEIATPPALLEAYRLIELAIAGPKHEFLDDVISGLIEHIEAQSRKLRKKSRIYSVEHLAEQVFEWVFEAKHLKCRVLYEFATVIHILNEIKYFINLFRAKGNSDQVQAYAEILKELIFEFVEYESTNYTKSSSQNGLSY